MRPSRLFLLVTATALALLMAAAPATSQVVIHEIMYHPETDALAEFLELYNPGPVAVDLQAWCVGGVDFCFGAGASIAAGGYRVLARDAAAFAAAYGFAADDVYPGQLSNTGETLTLLDHNTVLVDQVAYDCLPPWPVTPDGLGPSLELIDASEDNDTARNWRASTDASGHTAGAANSVAAAGLPPWITDPQHTVAVANQPITVTANVVDASSVDLVYLIDFGAEATVAMADDGLSGDGLAGDGVYGADIPGQVIDALVRYRLVATGATGTMESPRTDDTIEYYGTAVPDPGLSSALPVFHWYMDPLDFQAALDHFETDDTEPAVLVYDGQLWDGVQIRVRGQTARTFPKKHWKFIFPQGHEFFVPGLIEQPVDRFNLQGNWSDKTHMREILSYETLLAAGAPTLQAFNVRLQQNGEFFGLYHFLEQPDADWIVRMGLDGDGARYKAFDDCRKRNLVNLESRYDKLTRLDEDFSDLRDTLVAPLADLAGQARRDYIFDNIDIPGMVNYLAVFALVHNNDHVEKNYYLYRDTEGTGRWVMHPWDMDLTFGRNFVQLVLNDTIWADVDTIDGRPDVGPSHPLFGDATHQKWDFEWNRCIDALYDHSEIVEMFYRRLRTLMDEILLTSDYEDRIAQLEPLIAPEYSLDFLEWGHYGDNQTLSEATDILEQQYLALRRTHLATTHRVPNEIPTAQSSSTPAVVINEIMYNPISGSVHEFLELYNPSISESVDLSGWSVDNLDIIIPFGTVLLPNSFLVLVRDDPGFRAEYGSGKFIPGEYGMNLDNAGTSLVLRNRDGIEVDRVDYLDAAPWPVTPDGGGPSLELLDPAFDNNDAANWVASFANGGTPAAANSGGSVDLHVNEVVANNVSGLSDEMGEFDPWLEIYNSSGSLLDLSGMFLSDSAGTPNQWQIPATTTLCGGCWLVIWGDSETGEGPLHANFSLNPAGGEIYLWNSGLVLVDSLAYPALAADTSYGRFPDGTGTIIELGTATPENANQGPPTRVILNEYNAVSNSNFLGNNGSDTFWMQVLGNGGDWFELVVIEDHLDMRGWDLRITNDTGSPSESEVILSLTNDAIWSDLRSGTLITVSEQLADDIGYDPLNGDWWINVQAADTGTGTYITAMNFPVSNSNWQLTVRDDLGADVFGPAGEGIEPPSGVGSDEVFKLEEDPGPGITPFSTYNDGTSSTFGSPNVYSAGTMVQDFSALWINVGSVVAASVDAPSAGTVFQDTDDILIEASATSTNATITQIEFFANGGSLGTDDTAPFELLWVGAAADTYNLTAEATDSFGTTQLSSAVTIRVNARPTVSLTSPSPGATFEIGETVPLAATAADSDGSVAQVEFYVDSGSGLSLLGIDTTAPYTFDWNGAPVGNHTLVAVANDNDGARSSSAGVAIEVLEANQPPVIALTSPTAGQSFDTCDSITITATASDPARSVTSVKFFYDDGSGPFGIGEDTTAPYTLQWTPTFVGSLALTATATDNEGATTTSAAVAITVTAASCSDIFDDGFESGDTTGWTTAIGLAPSPKPNSER